jgi:hypothetical protein
MVVYPGRTGWHRLALVAGEGVAGARKLRERAFIFILGFGGMWWDVVRGEGRGSRMESGA